MITAVDTSVWLDLLIPGAAHGEQAEQALGGAAQDGTLVVCEVVYAELAAQFPTHELLQRCLTDTGVRLDRSRPDAMYVAGQRWASNARRRPRVLQCAGCGQSLAQPACAACGRALVVRQHVVADFVIGAHAALQADRLLTRDRGYYSTYFPESSSSSE